MLDPCSSWWSVCPVDTPQVILPKELPLPETLIIGGDAILIYRLGFKDNDPAYRSGKDAQQLIIRSGANLVRVARWLEREFRPFDFWARRYLKNKGSLPTPLTPPHTVMEWAFRRHTTLSQRDSVLAWPNLSFFLHLIQVLVGCEPATNRGAWSKSIKSLRLRRGELGRNRLNYRPQSIEFIFVMSLELWVL